MGPSGPSHAKSPATAVIISKFRNLTIEFFITDEIKVINVISSYSDYGISTPAVMAVFIIPAVIASWQNSLIKQSIAF